tara:strand:- start:4263 stop:4601 length:339 start_codon:yes stop_codon:yes gene_type:complete
MSNNFYIITGGPGVGKTTLVNQLKTEGYTIIPEVARNIIQEQIAINSNGLPWENKELYTNLMLEASISDYKNIIKGYTNDICFFDRSVYDAVCYARMIGYTISESVKQEIQL